MLNTRKYFMRENVVQIAFRSTISTGIICNEYYNSAGNCKLNINLKNS